MEFAVALFISLYTGLKVYLSVMQIGFVARKKKEVPVLMEQKEYVEAANYAVAKERLSIGESFLEMMLLLFWLSSGFALLQEYVKAEGVFSGVLYVGSFVALNFVVGLPFSYYKNMVLDKKFGFNKQSHKDYLLDTLKGVVIGIVFIVALSSGVLWFMDVSPLWWLYSFLFVMVVIIFINMLYPTVIAPLFNKFTPLEDGELKTAIESLLLKCGFKSSGVFVMDAGKRDVRLNAYFGGLGATKRVVLFDTLIEKLEKSEILAVLGHELGHFKHHDIWRNIAIISTLMFAMFLLFGLVPAGFYETFGVRVDHAVKLAFFILFFTPIMFFMTPVIGLFSRHAEYKADAFGSGLSEKDTLGDSLVKLVKENRSFPHSHPLYILFYYTHPPVVKRLEAMGYEIKR